MSRLWIIGIEGSLLIQDDVRVWFECISWEKRQTVLCICERVYFWQRKVMSGMPPLNQVHDTSNQIVTHSQ